MPMGRLSRTALVKASLSRNISSVRLRSVTSKQVARNPSPRRVPEINTLRSEPSLQVTRYSMGSISVPVRAARSRAAFQVSSTQAR